MNQCRTLEHLCTVRTLQAVSHRRRINTEEKAKVVAAIWGTECMQFLVALAVFHQVDLKNRMNLSFSSYHPSAIHPFLHVILVQNS